MRPCLDGLDRPSAAEVLHRAGVLTGWLGSFGQVEGAQECAKDFLSESASIFAELEESEKVCEARIDLAICYWREGAVDEARAILNDTLSQTRGGGTEQEGRALVALAMVERRAARYNDSLRHLREAAPIVESCPSHLRKGAFHNQLATVLENLGRAEGRADYTDQALLEYEAASFHFEQAGHHRYRACVETNLGFLFFKLNRPPEAHEHLDRARALFEEFRDLGTVSQVDDTRARVLLLEGRFEEAESVAACAVSMLKNGGEQSRLAEALTTYGKVLASLQKFAQAEAALHQAVEVGEQSGDLEGAGLAALTLMEELGGRLGADEMGALYERADDLLSRSQDAEVTARLRRCARRVISTPGAQTREKYAPELIHAAEETAEVLRRAQLIALAEGPVLLTGETGTGKEALARLIHQWSGRRGKFVTIRCAGVSESLFNMKLFGDEAPDVPNGFEDRGAVREAAGGTLFFDKVASLNPAGQAALLHLVEWAGRGTGNDPQAAGADVRIVASTNDDLARRVAEGCFRGDLFYRLQNFHIEIPPLRERPTDIPALATHFIERAAAGQRKRVTFTPEAVEAMRLLPLKGNVRELKSLIERTTLNAEDGAVVTAGMVEAAALRLRAPEDLADPWAGFSLKDEVHRIERGFIELALRDASGKVSRAARLLGFKHHESLASLLKNRHRELLSARTPSRPRRRSIIKKERR